MIGWTTDSDSQHAPGLSLGPAPWCPAQCDEPAPWCWSGSRYRRWGTFEHQLPWHPMKVWRGWGQSQGPSRHTSTGEERKKKTSFFPKHTKETTNQAAADIWLAVIVSPSQVKLRTLQLAQREDFCVFPFVLLLHKDTLWRIWSYAANKANNVTSCCWWWCHQIRLFEVCFF